MSNQPSSSFEKILENDIERLAVEIKSQRERPEMRNAAEAALIKEAIRAFPAAGQVRPAGPSATSGKTDEATNITSPLPGYAQNAPAEVKLEIEYLLDVALRGGLSRALDESKKSPYFVQDAFHDALAGRLYPELQRRGIVK